MRACPLPKSQLFAVGLGRVPLRLNPISLRQLSLFAGSNQAYLPFKYTTIRLPDYRTLLGLQSRHHQYPCLFLQSECLARRMHL